MKPIELETAKKLKELGLKNKSFSFWRLRNGGEEKGYKITHDTINADYLKNNKDILYMAYTLDEILAMLPTNVRLYHLDDSRKYRDYEFCLYALNGGGVTSLKSTVNKNPAEAAGQLLIWCIENGYVKVEDSNNAMV